MDIDPEDAFRDDKNEDYFRNHTERDATMEMVVYVVDASPKMFSTLCQSGDEKDVSHFEIVVRGIAQSLKTQIISRSYDEVAICFFNTREKKNLQDLNGVYVYNVHDRKDLDRITALLIQEFDCIQGYKQVGSKYGILSETRDNSLYNALWVAQALLRKGNAKRVDKRILLFTNEDDPFGNVRGVTKMDMMRTTLQRAQDTEDLGISIELLPLSKPGDQFNLSTFYAELLELGESELADFNALAAERFEDMKDQLRKRMFQKRKVGRMYLTISSGVSIELNAYALVRPANLGTITWLDSATNIPVKVERSFFCSDTGAQMEEPTRRFQIYKDQRIILSVDELSEMKRVRSRKLRLLGFKPMDCLKDYHNLRPSTFVYPSDEKMMGSSRAFIALHRSMLRLQRFAVAFYRTSTHPQFVALVAQGEIVNDGGQVEPPGMHIIYLPYSDDIRPIEEHLFQPNTVVPRATEDQIKCASSAVKRIDLKEFSVFQFPNPGLQNHFAVLQALALGEDKLPVVKDETLPDEAGLARPGVVKAVEEFKASVYGSEFEEEEEEAADKTVKKRKGHIDDRYGEYDWPALAESGELKGLRVPELKCYLINNGLPVSGKKDALIARILNHMGR
ncbi:hypothetical protein M569_01226 [Genlisea aurea]|uniref:SAP domain-containing protein n=1 Tax=Genlisea aurea TaxID=192259 RepID=S8D179_9LAMI|nr:hypothetical protein M569_01226 [Genlisea aurea]